MSADLKHFGVVAVLVLGLGCHLISLTSPYWGIVEEKDEISDKTFRKEYGLWEICVNGKYDLYPNTPDWLRVSQITAILGIVAALIATIVAGAIIHHLHKGTESTLLARVVALGTTFIAAMLITMTSGFMIVGLKQEVNQSINPGSSFSFSIAAVCLRLLGGCVVACMGPHLLNPPQSKPAFDLKTSHCL